MLFFGNLLNLYDTSNIWNNMKYLVIFGIISNPFFFNVFFCFFEPSISLIYERSHYFWIISNLCFFEMILKLFCSLDSNLSLEKQRDRTKTMKPSRAPFQNIMTNQSHNCAMSNSEKPRISYQVTSNRPRKLAYPIYGKRKLAFSQLPFKGDMFVER